MHIIKKYANRKMYDTTNKHYISMKELAVLIKDGAEVTVIDNTTGEDITVAVVSQLLSQTDTDSEKGVSSKLLMQLVRRGGGTITDYAKKYASLWQSAFTMADDEIDKLMGALIKSKELSKNEVGRLKKEIIGYSANIKEWVNDRVDQRMKEAFSYMNLATHDQMKELAAKIEQIAEKVHQLEKRQAENHQTTIKKKATAKKKTPKRKTPPKKKSPPKTKTDR